MRTNAFHISLFCLFSLLLSGCSHYSSSADPSYCRGKRSVPYNPQVYAARMPQRVATAEKTVIVDPSRHAWGAYDQAGRLIKGGLATAGGNWCSDLGRPCRTKTGIFRVNSLGDPGCKSKIFPLHKGGAPMPFCMYFNRGQALHGSPSGEVVDGNISHGCVRLKVEDAAWLRYQFVNVGTKVVVRSY